MVTGGRASCFRKDSWGPACADEVLQALQLAGHSQDKNMHFEDPPASESRRGEGRTMDFFVAERSSEDPSMNQFYTGPVMSSGGPANVGIVGIEG